MLDRLGELERPATSTIPRSAARSPSARSSVASGARTAPRRRGPARPRSPDGREDNAIFEAAVPRQSRRQGHDDRRDRRLPQPDGAVPQPVGVPARETARTTPAFKDRVTRDAARAARPSLSARGPARPPGRLGPLRRQRPTATTSWSTTTSRARPSGPLQFPRQRGRAVAVHRRLLRARSSSGRRRLRQLHAGHHGPARLRALPRSSSRPTSISDYLFLHGLGVEMAEALAELWHRRIREELGIADEDGPSIAGLFRQQYRGGRYSWGYPACPDLMDNAKVAELLGAARIGVDACPRASSSTPSRRPTPSSATTPRRSTSLPEHAEPATALLELTLGAPAAGGGFVRAGRGRSRHLRPTRPPRRAGPAPSSPRATPAGPAPTPSRSSSRRPIG